MIGFLKTSKDKRHYHLVLIDSDSKIGKTSIDKDHDHGVIYLDSEEGPKWLLTPASDGHAHEINLPVVPKDQRPEEDEKEVVAQVISLFKRAREIEYDFRKSAEDSEKFYKGDQWERDIKDRLISESRSALTINEIEPKIDLLSGYQRQNRIDIKYFPVEGGDAAVAEVLNILVKNILEQNNFDYEETESFEDCLITGRGFFNVYVDYDKNIEGDIVIESFPWESVYLGPHRKKNLADLEYLIKSQWQSSARVKRTWPEKADKISEIFSFFDNESSVERTIKEDYGRDSGAGHELYPFADPDLVDIARKNINVLECWRKEYYKVTILVNPEIGLYQSTMGWTDEEIAKAKRIPGISSIDINKTRMRVSVIANNVLLEDYYSQLFDDEFPIIAIYAKKRGNYVWGKVEPVKDVQKEINKRVSQSIDILNRVAPYGWMYDSMTFPTPQDEENWKMVASVPGFNVKINDVSRPPRLFEGVKFPGEILEAQKIASDKIKEIMNINLEMLGLKTPAPSGIAIIERKRQGLIGNEFIFDNLGLAKRILGRLIIKLIQKIYSIERIVRIIGSRIKRGEKLPPNVLEGQEFDESKLYELLRDKDLSKYDVVVGESAFSPTNRMANFVIWAEMARNGIPVPHELLVDLSDLPEKEKVKEAIRAQSEAAAVDREKTRQVELLKSGVNPITGERIAKETAK